MSHTVFRPENGRWGSQTPALFTFALRPVAIESRPGLPKPVMTEQVDPRSGATRVAEPWWAHPSAVDCIAVDLGECALERTFPEEYRYRVTFRMRDAANMYLNGAQEARKTPSVPNAGTVAPDMISAISSPQLFDLLAIRVDPEKAKGKSQKS
jgi:hypothetical protein